MAVGQRLTRCAAAVLLALGVAACQPIVARPDGITSKATRAVSPTSVVVAGVSRPAIEIRMRDCHTFQMRFPSLTSDEHLRPFAEVTDANGQVLHQDLLAASRVVRPGARVIDGGTADAHRIVIPVNGGKLPLRIESGCTAHPGTGPGGPGLTRQWTFPVCVTANRTCTTTRPGQGSADI